MLQRDLDYNADDISEDHLALLRRYCHLGFIFIVGFTTPFTVAAVGSFPLAELFLVLLAGAALIKAVVLRQPLSSVMRSRWFKRLLIAQAIGICAYIASDLYRGTVPYNYTRGWARMIFLWIDLVGVAALTGYSWKNFAWLKVGQAFGMMASSLATGPLFENYWKFCFAVPVTWLALILARRFSIWQICLVAVILASVHFILGYRSYGGICLLLAAIIWVPLLPKIFRRTWVIVGVVLLISAGGIGYVFASGSSNAFAKSSNSERYAMIATSAQLFAESPLIGNGSWFTNSTLLKRLEQNRSRFDEGFGGYSDDEAAKLAIHSQILVSLAEGGIGGGAFFCVYAGLLAWAVAYALRSKRPYQALILLLLLDATWDLWMSPFSGPKRIYIATTAVMAIMLWRESRGELSEDTVRS